MFFFVLEFLFYAFIILAGLGLLLHILASDAFWNGFAVLILFAVVGGVLAAAVWGLSSLTLDTLAQGLAGIAGALLACVPFIPFNWRRLGGADRCIPAITGLVVAATAVGGGAYLIWQDSNGLIEAALVGCLGAALIVGLGVIKAVVDERERNERRRRLAERAAQPPHEYKYEKVP